MSSPRRLRRGAIATATAAMAFAFGSSLAQDEIPEGFYPAIGVGIDYTDNLLRTTDNEISDHAYIVIPSLLWRIPWRKHDLDFIYAGEFARWQDISNEDYDDHSLLGRLNLDLSRILDLDLQGGYDRNHEERGSSGSSIELTEVPDEWDETFVGARAVLGRRSARLQLAGEIEEREYRFLNNGQEFRDRDVSTLDASLLWNVSSRTALVLEFEHQDLDYLDPRPQNLDSTEDSFLLGANWQATAKTSGTFRIGRLEKDLDDPALEDFDGTRLGLDVTWRYKPYSIFVARAAREPNESATAGDTFYLSDWFEVEWLHRFSDRFRFDASVGVRSDDYSLSERVDDFQGWGVGVTYAFRRWVNIRAGYDYLERDSTVPEGDYTENSVTLRAIFGRERE